MPKRNYTIYCDESDQTGKYFANFFGGSLIRSRDREAIEKILNEKKDELNLFKELKWTYITENYCEKYINFIDSYFDLIERNKIKARIMFTHNRYVPKNLTDEHHENRYFILYYHLIKHAFGLSYCNPSKIDKINVQLLLDDVPNNSEKFLEFKNYISNISRSQIFRDANVSINMEDIADVDSKNHVILQGLDIILGAMQFRLNDKHKEKPKGSHRRGKRTIAKEKVYKAINRRIQKIYPHFNVGISTGTRNGLSDRWKHAYRHWKFVPSDHEIDDGIVKK